MARTSSISFNPADYFFYSHDLMMRRKRQGGNIALMSMDLDGHIAPDDLQAAILSVYQQHPVLAARLGMSLMWGRPVWKAPNDAAMIEGQARAAYQYDDLHERVDALQVADELFQQRYLAEWDLQHGPQMRFEHYDLPDDKTRLVIRWPHMLMDAEGAMWMLARMDAAKPTPSGAPFDGLHQDKQLNDPLAGQGFFKRLQLLLASFSAQRQSVNKTIRTLFDHEHPPFEDYRCIHRSWDRAAGEAIKEKARKLTPAGPALYGRFFAVCILRALRRVFAERKVETDAYLITMPQNLSFIGADDPKRHTRPLQGNYIVSPTLYGERELIDDRVALAASLSEQLESYRKRDVHLKQWAMFWAADWSRWWFYQMLMRLPLGLEALSSGYSYYGEIRYPIRNICGAQVTNLWGAGPLPTPPAWNPVFCWFDGVLNFSLTYTRPVVSDELAERYAEYIFEEIDRALSEVG